MNRTELQLHPPSSVARWCLVLGEGRDRYVRLLWYRDACKSERPDHRFSGQTSRLACVYLFTPIDSEFEGHANAVKRYTHAILGPKVDFSAWPGSAGLILKHA